MEIYTLNINCHKAMVGILSYTINKSMRTVIINKPCKVV